MRSPRPLLFLALLATSASAQVISSDTTWSGAVSITRDVQVNAGVTLTVAAGTTITVTTTDAANLGTDAAHVELIVLGTLAVNGNGASPVLFTSAGTSAGSWTGIRVAAGGTLTASSTTLEEATYAVDSSGSVTFSNGIARSNTYGFRTNAGTTNVLTTFFTGNTFGAYGVSGSLSVDHSTLVSNTYGVYSSGTSGAVSITNSVVTANGSGLYQYNTIALGNSYNDVWGNTSANYTSVSPGTGSISSNPLYVGSGTTPNRLTSNSPARKSDSTGGDMGAFPYTSDATVGLMGTLWVNTTVATSQSLLGDLVVPAGITLTLPPGVTLTAATSDQMQAGNDTSHIELIVRGTLTVAASGNPVTLTSSGASAGAWTGIRVESGGSLSASGLVLEKATYGIDSAASVTFSGGIARNNTYGFRVNAGTTTIGTTLFTGNTFGAYGISGSLSVDHSTLVSNTYGIYSSGTSGAVGITNSVVTANGSGLYQYNTIALGNSYNDVWGNTSANYTSVSPGTGSISSNPLYVGSGTTPNRLTSNSPARKSDSTGGDMGAFPYTSDATVGLMGTLWTGVTLGTESLLGDLIIPAGVTVVLPAGVTLTAATSDQMQAGNDTSHIEIIVRGTLQVTGTGSMPATVTSSGASAGAWAGIRVESGATLTASSLVLEKATYGIDSAASVTFTGGIARNNTYGFRVNAGTTTIGTTFFTGNTFGAYGISGSLSVDHSTLVSNTYGVYSSGTSGAVSITNSVVTANGTGLYQYNTIALGNSYNDVWGNTSANYTSVSPGTGSISSNPLYVGSGTTPNRLTSNSPARNSDSTGGDMGAFPYTSDATVGLLGTLWVNTTVATSQSLLGDLVVPAGITLSIAPGVTLTAATSDQMQAGNDTSHVELIVRGTLSVSALGNPVTLTSSGASAGAWTGVRVESGGSLSASGLVLEKATYGIDSAASVTFTGGIARNNTYGFRVNAGTTTIGTTLFTGNTFGAYGISGSLSVDHSTLVSNTYGIYSSGTSGAVGITNSVVTANGTGLYQYNTIALGNSYNDVWGNTSANYTSVSPGTGSISSNPLYVASGTTPYRLTSNSPARKSDSTGGDMGAFPWLGDATTGLMGTLWIDTTISLTQSLLGDLIVPMGVTLTIAPGVMLTAATSDQMQAGNDTSHIELIVRGTLTVAASGNPVTLTSSGASAGAWTGIRVEATGAATLTGINVSKATYGVDALSNVNLTEAALTNNTYGLRTSAGSSQVSRSLFTGNTFGAYGISGSLSLDHSTLVSNTYGIYSSGTSGSVSLTNSVATANNYGLYQYNTITLANSFNDVWGNTTANYTTATPGTGSISGNPLYVATGATPYRLTSNSPARKSDSTAGDMGAFAYTTDPTVGLLGTLWSNTTLNTTQALLGDLTVPPGVTVTVAAGVTLTAPTSDQMQSGSDTSRTEVIVQGTLQLSGTGASPVVLTSSGASAGSWTGVRVVPGGTANVNSATLSKASYCLDLAGAATVTASRFTACTYGVRSTAGTHTITFSVFDANTTGMQANGGTDTLDHLTAYSNSYGVYSAGTSGSVGVTNSIFSANTYGLYKYNTIAITNSYNLFFTSPLGTVTLGSNSTTTVDPLLVAPATGDFHLQSTSPARMAGTSSSDLGAFPFAPGAVDHVVIAPSSATVSAGGTFTFSATAYDVVNNPVPTATITWSALGTAGVITPGGVLTASCTPGTISAGVTATSNGKSASASVTITTAPIANLVVTPSNATVKSQQTQAFTVTALDVCNNPVSSPAITWSVTGSAGIVDPVGVYTAGCSRGAFPLAVVATAGSIVGRASVTVDPGVLSSVSISPTTASVAVGGTRQFTGTAADGCGNPLTPVITWANSVTGANINTSGLFTAGTTPGTFNAGVTASASEGAVSRSASSTVTVTGGTVATVTVMPGTATLQPGATANFSAVAVDSFGNMVPGTATWSLVSGGGSINAGTGAFTAGTTAGTFANTVRATIAGVNGTATVIVQPGPATRVTVSPAMVTLAPGGSTTFTAQAFDANNNVVTTAISWAASAASGTINQGGVFTAGSMSGNYPAAITATAGSLSGSASVSINAGALSQLSLTPSVATTQAGGTLAFTATGRDGNNNTVAVTPTWSVVAGGGTISPTGIFSAGTTTGTFANTVRAESNGVTAFATVSVTAGPLVLLELNPASADLLVGATAQFAGTGKDAFGNTVPANITWTTNPNAGAITAGGLFTAGTLAGDYADGVRATAGAVSTTASIHVRSATVIDAGVVDAGPVEPVDAGPMLTDAGTMTEADAGTMTAADGGTGLIQGATGCGCSQGDALAPLMGLLALALRRRRS